MFNVFWIYEKSWMPWEEDFYVRKCEKKQFNRYQWGRRYSALSIQVTIYYDIQNIELGLMSK